MSLYPSLEDMMAQGSAQSAPAATGAAQPSLAQAQPQKALEGAVSSPPSYPSLYPALDDMGLEVSSAILQEHNMAVAQLASSQVAVPAASVVAPSTQSMVAPVTGRNEVGMMRAEIKQGVRPITLCKDAGGKVGVALATINKGIFVAFVYKNSPAAMAGLRFGDQILQINDVVTAGMKVSEASKLIAKASPERLVFALRDRPFERTITMQKDSHNHVGFIFKKALIHSIVKDSSAAKNGLLIQHYLVEVNGQNVVGLSDNAITQIFADGPRSVTVTIMPKFLFDHMIKHIGSIKKYMDHSVPEL